MSPAERKIIQLAPRLGEMGRSCPDSGEIMSDVKNIVSSVNRVEPLSGVSGGKQGSLLMEVYKQKLFLFKTQRDLVDYVKESDRLAKKCQAGNNEMDSLGAQEKHLESDKKETAKLRKKMALQNIYLSKLHSDFSTQIKKIRSAREQIGKAEDYLKAHQKELEEVLQQKHKPQVKLEKLLLGASALKRRICQH
jgi:hypothetical protein